MSISLPGARRLVFAGSEAGWPWLWLAAGAAAVLLLLWLYREERRLVSRRAGLCLLGLRLIAAGVLVLALFEPIAARTFRQTVRGRLVVAVDTSESMETADPGRTADERDRLARVFALSPGAAETVDRLPRREVARRLLGGPLARLTAEHRVEALAFARQASSPATLEGLAELLKSPPKPGDPAARTTDWLPALEQALKEDRDRGGGGGDAPALGVVLLTDGQRNAPADTAATVDRLAARGIPVFPVLIGSTRPPTDAAIAALRVPESVYRGDTATVEARLKLDGQAGRDLTVTLEGPGIDPMRQTVRAPADGTRPAVVFRVPLERPGAVPLTVRVGPVEGDARPDNDQRTAVVQVADDRARVLLVDGEARWEFQYLRNALARDPRVEVSAVVFHQPSWTASLAPDASSTYQEKLPEPDPTTAAPETDPLGDFDVIVLGDVDPADLPADAWTRLEAFVAERGGTLVFAPGPRFAEALTAVGAARALLPVLDPRSIPVDADAEIDPEHPALPPGLPFVPTAEAVADAASWPMLQLAADAEESSRRWAGLPRLPWVLAGQTKPGATTLATTTGGDGSTIFAAQPYGLGKTVVVGTDGTWRWRHRVGDAYHHRFWGQVVRWAASGELGAGNALVRFGPRRPRADEGAPVVFEARVGEAARGLPTGLMLAARVHPVGADGQADARSEALAVVPLRPVAGRPRGFEGTAPSLPAGRYVVRLDAPGAAEALGLVATPGSRTPVPEATLEIVERDGPERVELAAARDPLDRLASATGGQVLTDDRADALPSLLHGRVRTVGRTEEVPLWDQPAALLLFLGLLTAEWLARKWLGLP